MARNKTDVPKSSSTSKRKSKAVAPSPNTMSGPRVNRRSAKDPVNLIIYKGQSKTTYNPVIQADLPFEMATSEAIRTAAKEDVVNENGEPLFHFHWDCMKWLSVKKSGNVSVPHTLTALPLNALEAAINQFKVVPEVSKVGLMDENYKPLTFAQVRCL